MKIKSLFISDTHLGHSAANTSDLLNLFRSIEKVDNIFIVGDFIDGWYLKRNGINHFGQTQNTVIQKLLKFSRHGTNIHYIVGNHDMFLNEYVGQNFGNIFLHEDYRYTGIKYDMFLHHGHAVDWASRGNLMWVSKLGDIGYSILIRINYIHDKIMRMLKITPNKSLSRMVKERVKGSLVFVENFERLAVEYAQTKSNGKNPDVVICGHIHTQKQKTIDGMIYINIGDFLEGKEYCYEDLQGEIVLKSLNIN